MSREMNERPTGVSPAVYRFLGFEVDCESGAVHRGDEPQRDMQPRPASVLRVLLENHGKLVPRERLVQEVWGVEAVTDAAVDWVISELRRTFGASHNGRKLIFTSKKRGFRFEFPVERVSSDAPPTASAAPAPAAAPATPPHPDPLAASAPPIAAPASAPRIIIVNGEVPIHGEVPAGPAADTTAGKGIDLRELVSPQLAFVSSRAALESLELRRMPEVIPACTDLLGSSRYAVGAHIVLANAYVLRFESTRAQAFPDYASLQLADQHAETACALEPMSPDAWSARAHVLHRRGQQEEALACAREAVWLTPKEWRFHLRLGFIAGGAERLRAAEALLRESEHNPLGHFLAATVYIGRQTFAQAEIELDHGCAGQDRQRGHAGVRGRVHAVGLHWLRGLVKMRAGDLRTARAAFEHELTFENSDHLVGPEVCAATYHALGALELRGGQERRAREHFTEALMRVSGYGPSLAVLYAMYGTAQAMGHVVPPRNAGYSHDPVALAIAQAVGLTCAGRRRDASMLTLNALRAQAAVGPGPAWHVPVEPILNVYATAGDPEADDLWPAVLAYLFDLCS